MAPNIENLIGGGFEDELVSSDFLLRGFDLGNHEQMRQLTEEAETESL